MSDELTHAESELPSRDGSPEANHRSVKIPRRALLAGGSAAAAAAAVALGRGGLAGAVGSGNLTGWPVFDVTSSTYLADPTGVADSTTAIQNAINDAQTAVTGTRPTQGINGIVYLPPGQYRIDGIINVPASTPGLMFDNPGGVSVIGAGGGYPGPNQGAPATTLVLNASTAQIQLNGRGLYQGFTVHAGPATESGTVADYPLKRGDETTNNQGEYATFIDVWVHGANKDGWTIHQTQNDSFYSCGCSNSGGSNLNIDYGAGGFQFFHWIDIDPGTYGIYATDGHNGGGFGQTVQAIRFWGGFMLTTAQAGSSTSKIWLQKAEDIGFLKMQINGSKCTGPTVRIDQSSCNSLDFTGTVLISNNGQACIEVHGAAQTNAVLCLVTDNCAFNCTVANGGNSISLLGTGVSLISAAGWIGDLTGGPVAASGLNDINTQLQGRTGPWVTLSTAPPLGSGWSGTVSYRINSDGRVEFVGALSGPTGTTAFTLPAGYRPASAATLLGLMGSGVGSIAVSTLGAVTPTGATAGGVAFDGLSLPVR